ncbi:MAG: transposase family protein [Methylococcales bacterium]|nr:transposase family protein [Methylococcales bacterium]
MRALTGLTLKQFDELLGDFDSAYEKALDADRSKRGCERKKGAGKKPRLANARLKLFFVLIYLKCYPTYDVLGMLFDLDSGNCCDWIKTFAARFGDDVGQKTGVARTQNPQC